MVSTGYRGHYINVDWMGNDVTIDIKGSVLVDGYTLAVDRTRTLWSDAPIEWARARIDLAIETHPHTYPTLTTACKVCKSGVVRAVPMTPERIAYLESLLRSVAEQRPDVRAMLTDWLAEAKS